MFEHGKPDASSPLGQRMKGVEVEKEAVLARCRYTKDVLKRLNVMRTGRECFDLSAAKPSNIATTQEFTILIDASARLMKVGGTSPS